MFKYILFYYFLYLSLSSVINSEISIKLDTISTILFQKDISATQNNIINSKCIIGKIINELKNDLKLRKILINFNNDNENDDNIYDLYIGENNYNYNNNSNSSSGKQDLDEIIITPIQSLSPLWYYYQFDYCFIYANTKRILAHAALTKNLLSRDWLLLCSPIILTTFYFYLILHLRFLINKVESMTKGMLYALQTHLLSSVPRTSTFASDRIFLAAMLIFIFELNFLFQAYLTTQITIPTYKPSDEAVIDVPMANEINLTHSVGYGKTCVKEINEGIFKQRICMLECTEANLIVKRYQSIYKLKDKSINFHGFIQINEKSRFYKKIEHLIEVYTESGLIDKWFKDDYLQSYKSIRLALEHHRMSAYELNGLFLNTIVIGLATALITFLIELLWFYRCNNI